jgi:hypothetical protein
MAQAAPAGDIQAQIQGEVSGQIAVGNFNVQIGSLHGGVVNVIPAGQQPVPQPRPLPVAVRPRPFPGLLGREPEVAAATAAIAAATPVEFYSAAGWGKTALLRTLAHRPAPALPDGVAYLSAARLPLTDLLQCVYDTFYECAVPFKPTDAQLRIALQNKRALILLDDVGVAREEVETLLGVAPGCGFVLAAPDRRLWGEGRPLALHGLPDPAALALLERELGRALAPAEQPTAAALCAAVGGQPLGVIQAAARVRDDGQALEQALREAQPATPAPAAPPPPDLGSLSTAEQQILAVLAAAGGATVGQEHLAPLTGQQDVVPALEALLRRGLVEAHSPRYSLTGDLPAHLAQLWDLHPWDDRLLGYFTTWAEAHQREPEQVREESDAIMQTLRRAGVRADRQAAVVRLGRAVEGPLALGAMWGAWAEVLDWIGQAAGVLNDSAASAWTLHQSGTRALGLGDTTAAEANLRQALALRESLGDQLGAAVTRHNLEILIPPPPPRRGGASQRTLDPPDGGSTLGTAVRGIPLFLKIGLGLLIVVGVLVGVLVLGPHAALTIDNGAGCVTIPAAPFPIGNIPGIAGLDTPIAAGESRAVDLPSSLISQLGIINAGAQFTITVGPLSYPFEVGGATRRLLLNDAVIWERARPNPAPHPIPLDTTGPLNLRIECVAPGLSLRRGAK